MNESVLFYGNDEELYRLLKGAAILAKIKMRREKIFSDFLEALHEETYFLLLIDTDFADMDTAEYNREIRKIDKTTPILYFGSFLDQIKNFALNLQKDKNFYITKPFSPTVLFENIATITEMNRTIFRLKEKTIEAGPFMYDLNCCGAFVHYKYLPLERRENALFRLFIENKTKCLTKEFIKDEIWQENPVTEEEIDDTVRKLSWKLKDASKMLTPCIYYYRDGYYLNI